jgi:hypothetical protein
MHDRYSCYAKTPDAWRRRKRSTSATQLQTLEMLLTARDVPLCDESGDELG